MGIRECLQLGWYDLKIKKENAFQFFFNILFITTMTIMLGAFNFAIQRNHNDLVINKTSISGIFHQLQLDKNGDIIHNGDYELSQRLYENFDTSDIQQYSKLDLLAFLGKTNWLFLNIDHVSLLADGKIYYGKNDYSYDFEFEKKEYCENDSDYAVPFSMEAVTLSYQYPTEIIRKEFAYRYPKEKILLCGRYLENNNEVIISEYMLNKFGIYDNYETYIGKNIFFYVDGEEILKEYKLVGVLNTNFFRVTANTSRSQIWVAGNHDVYKKYKCTYIEEHIGVHSFSETGKLEKELDIIGKGEYWTSGFQQEYEFVEKTKLVIEKIVRVMVFIVVTAVFLKIGSSIYIDMKKNAYYYGMLRTIGMKNYLLYLLAMSKLIFLTILAVIASMLISFIGMYVLQKMMIEMFYLQLSIKLWDYMKAAIIVFLGVNSVLSVITYMCYNKLFKMEAAENMKIS